MNSTNPFAVLIKSKRFWVIILTAVVDFLVGVVPDLAGVRSELLLVFTTLGSVLVSGYSIEDAAETHAVATVQAQSALNAQTAYDRNRDR